MKIQNTCYCSGILFCYFFAYYLQLGLIGIVLARTFTDLLCLCGMGYVFLKNDTYRSVLVEFNIQNVLNNMTNYLKVTFPIGATIYLEWTFFEIMTIYCGALKNDAALSGYSVFFSIIFLFFGISLGFSWTVNSYLGNLIGAGKLEESKNFIKKALYLCLILVIIFTISGHLLKNFFLEFLIPESQIEIREQFLICYNLYINLVFLPDSFQSILGAILKSCGHENYSAKYFLIVYYLIGLPLSYVLVFGLGIGMPAIWISEFILSMGVCIIFLVKIY